MRSTLRTKLSKIGLLTFFVSASSFGLSYELPWKLLTTHAILPPGNSMQIAVPAQYIPIRDGWGRVYYKWQAPNITEFIIRVRKNLRNQCEPLEHTRGAIVFTGIGSNQRASTPTKLVNLEESPSKPGWTNYIFSVNGGIGLPAQSINPAFKTGRALRCVFDVLYREGSGYPVYPLNAERGSNPVGRDGKKEVKEKQQKMIQQSVQVMQQAQQINQIQQKKKEDRSKEEQKQLEQGIQVQTN